MLNQTSSVFQSMSWDLKCKMATKHRVAGVSAGSTAGCVISFTEKNWTLSLVEVLGYS
ncbi:MAG: hypothetical protein ACK5AY_10710 [Bacteroidota bacterium]